MHWGFLRNSWLRQESFGFEVTNSVGFGLLKSSGLDGFLGFVGRLERTSFQAPGRLRPRREKKAIWAKTPEDYRRQKRKRRRRVFFCFFFSLSFFLDLEKGQKDLEISSLINL